MDKYSQQQLDKIKFLNEENLHFFGYVNSPEGKDKNHTDFFKFENRKPELID